MSEKERVMAWLDDLEMLGAGLGPTTPDLARAAGHLIKAAEQENARLREALKRIRDSDVEPEGGGMWSQDSGYEFAEALASIAGAALQGKEEGR